MPITAADLSPPALFVLAAVIAIIAIAVAWWTSRRTGWPPAGGLVLLAATPLVPHVPVALGVSLDDILPVLGVAALLVALDPQRLRFVRVPRLLAGGLVLLVAAGLISSVVNAADVVEALRMALRGAGRMLLLAAIVVAVSLATPADRRRWLVARALALLGTAEAAFGLAAFFLPLNGIGLEPTRKYSVLYFEVPGRIAGTLGISPNFLGAIFILTILLTAGLALTAGDRRRQAAWWAAVTVQAFALTLTFTRASLGLAVVCLVVLILIRGRVRYLAPVGLAIAIGFAITPALERLTADVPDRLALWTSATRMMFDHPLAGVGPGRTVEVARSDPGRYLDTPFGSATNSAHNTVLIAGAETGILGAVGATLVNLGFLSACLRVLVRARRPDASVVQVAAAIGALGYLVQGMVNNLFNVAPAGAAFALVAGAFLVELAHDGPESGP